MIEKYRVAYRAGECPKRPNATGRFRATKSRNFPINVCGNVMHYLTNIGERFVQIVPIVFATNAR
jgi:hypothetical protein